MTTTAFQLHQGRVYPRACGGTILRRMGRGPYKGLSPRVRGNRPGVCTSICCQRVYPRACGGTMKNSVCFASSVGLSPRVRGNRRGGNPGGGPNGSIPARAGEPAAWARPRSP